MGLFGQKISEITSRKKVFKEMQDRDRMETKLQDRKMTSEERELMGYKEKERQENIKKELAVYRKKEDKTVWTGAPLKQREDISKHSNAFPNSHVFKSKVTI